MPVAPVHELNALNITLDKNNKCNEIKKQTTQVKATKHKNCTEN